MTESRSRALARRFASLLDADDFAALEPMLAAGCVYDARTEVFEGPRAILASYREASDRARARFDAVRYDSHVVGSGHDFAVILFRDHLTLRGETHVHRCEQRVTFGTGGSVMRIEHRELPGERESLEEFLARADERA